MEKVRRKNLHAVNICMPQKRRLLRLKLMKSSYSSSSGSKSGGNNDARKERGGEETE